MRCNACWRELEGKAISTTCGHLLCDEDANKILNKDAACAVCDQVLSKSLMKPVDINPNDEWINMAMGYLQRYEWTTGWVTHLSLTQISVMKSAYKSVMFYIEQKELEMQFEMKSIVAPYRQKCKEMQEIFTERLEQVHTAYQKMAEKCQVMEQEIKSLSKDKQELQEKFSEKSRQKRKLDEMYDQLRGEYEFLKRSSIQPGNNFFSRGESDLLPGPANMMDNRDPIRKDWLVFTPETPGPREYMWAPTARQNSFNISNGAPVKESAMPHDTGNRNPGGSTIPSMALRNLFLSPIKRPQLISQWASKYSFPSRFTDREQDIRSFRLPD